jgi:pimeloyl-ACP methyl ester carboxylesterase
MTAYRNKVPTRAGNIFSAPLFVSVFTLLHKAAKLLRRFRVLKQINTLASLIGSSWSDSNLFDLGYSLIKHNYPALRDRSISQKLWNQANLLAMKTPFNSYRLLGLLLMIFCYSFGSPAYSQQQLPLSHEGERFVAIGNHRLFMIDTGDQHAKLVVVFEAGGGGKSGDWAKVKAMLPAGVRTIAYDRAGIGKSEKGPLPQTLAQNVLELHELLKAVNPKARIILVGQSIGGMIARLYAQKYGQEVAGLVLVDPAHESGFYGSMKYGGWVRLREKAAGKPIPQPQIKSDISNGYDSTADYLAEEFQNMYGIVQKNGRSLGNLPLIVLGAGIRLPPPGTPEEQWKELKHERDKQVEELAGLSANSVFILDPKSSHQIQNDNPGIVVKSILTLINTIVSGTKLSAASIL